MKRMLVIADDLTGAAEIGGIGVQHGMSARIVVGEYRDDEPADLLVIDTNTRHRQPHEAAEVIGSILGRCDRNDFDLIYKKTDSVLRGAIGAEIDAMLAVLQCERALLAPQNPTLGRTIRNGRYFINGVPLDATDFARDPEHPRTSADVRELIVDAGNRITIASGESAEDLCALARQCGPSVLPAGGADFFAAVLEQLGFHRRDVLPRSEISGDQFFVCGSAALCSREAVEAAVAKGVPVLSMPARLFHAAVRDERMIVDWADQVSESLRSCGKAVMSVREPMLAHQARHVRQVMASTVARILTRHRVGALWIEGGATAAEIVDAMEWRTFRVDGVIAAGVVSLCALDEQDQRLIIKPGSYAWPPGVV
jgi:uncharacterized protein YgbK (DUF1537 family)